MGATTARQAIDFDLYIKERTDRFSGRNWVFDRIHEWLALPERNRFFLLTGEPGSGKTALAARLAQFSSGSAAPPANCQRFSLGFLGAIHFCSARTGTWIDPIGFARSISLQLAQANPRFAQALRSVGDRSVNIQVTQSVAAAANVTAVVIENLVLTGLNPQAAFNAAVVAPLEEIYHQGFDGELTILVDALDEALAFKGEIGIPQLLASMYGLPPAVRVRLILTSRRDRTIEGEFLRAETFALSSEKYDEDNEIDISSFVNARLAGTVYSGSVDEIVRKAERNFQYVTFLLNQLQNDGVAAMSGLPAGLDPLYRDSLARVIGHRDWEQEFAPVMGLLSVAREGLTEAHLKNFSGFKEREILGRLAELRPFVEESGTPRAYRFYHQSVVDFLHLRDLAQSGGSLINEYYLPAAEWHERIAQYYVPDGPASWSRWDAYGLRYTVSHLAEAVREETNGNRALLISRLVDLVTNSQYREQHLRDIDDMPALQRDLLEAVRCAALNHDASGILPLVHSALALVAFRDRELRPPVVFDLATAGEVERAARRLELFEVDQDWIQAALLIIAWLGAKSDPAGARLLLSRVKPQGGPVEHLLQQVSAAIDETPPPVNTSPLNLPISEDQVAALVDRFGGKGGDPEMLQRLVNDSLINVTRGIDAAGYFAEQDAPILVSFAVNHPGGDRYLRQYIAIHSGYQYVQYRNQSLWIVLSNILRHPDPDWIRDTARELATTALAGSSLEFREALPLTVLGLQAISGNAAAMQRLAELRQRSIADASEALDPAASANLNMMWGSQSSGPPAGTGTSQRGDDSWGSHRRRLAIHAQILARLLGAATEAFDLVLRAARLKKGFAGFQAPACVMLAEAVLISNPAAQDTIGALLDAASQAAHNIQDASFCLRITSRCNALRERWWGTRDLERCVTLLVENPRAPGLSALHRIGERFTDRDQAGLRIPEDVRAAVSLKSIAAIYHCALSDLQRANSEIDPLKDLSEGTLINVPDPGFATWIATHLSAELLSKPTLSDSERVALMQLLVPVASPNPTLLDTVLARLLLAARPVDPSVLAELEHLAGPAQIHNFAAFEASLPT
jgi:predicted ATPase